MSHQRRKTALVVGATSRVGQACIKQLLALGYHVTYTVARKWDAPFDAPKDRLTARKLNLENIEYFKIERWMEDFDLAVLIPPIYLSKNILPYAEAAGIKRLIFISSYNTYRFGHTAAYAPLKAAESHILSSPLTSFIIQPTMIIGHAQSSATKIILNKAKQGKAFYGIKGRPALQQPIDFRDLATAIVHVASNDTLDPGRYPVGGKYVTSSQELYIGISRLIDKPARFMTLPRLISSPLIKTISTIAPKSNITAYLERLGQDRHCVHDTLPGWTPDYSLTDSLENLRDELREQT